MEAGDVADWLISEGLLGASQSALLSGFCERLLATGLSIHRAYVSQTALHPELGGRGFEWRRAKTDVAVDTYPRESQTEGWLRSPFYYMLNEPAPELHLPLGDDAPGKRFPILAAFRNEGVTDYFAMMLGFARSSLDDGFDPDDPPDGMIFSCTTDAPCGFSDDDLDTMRALIPTFGLALKSTSMRQMATDVLTTYLGPDAGARVLSGSIERGSVETIHAVILNFDLQGFTRLAENTPGDVVVAMLNEYFGAIVAAVEANGGNVLKFMGDGLLAIHTIDENGRAHESAVNAAAAIRREMARVNARRSAAGLPHTGFGLSLHSGDLMYGNIGAENRLDFTIIGPAVNAAARIQDMCRSLERDVIMSANVARPLIDQRDDIVSLGRYVLRGVSEPQELFTLVGSEHR